MKKNISILIIVCAIVIAFIIFIPKKASMTKSDKKISNDYKLEIIENTNTSLKYKITTDDTVYTTPYYDIEMYKDDSWYSFDIAVSSNALEIKIEKEYTDDINFELIYGNLKKGKYRFIKKVNGKYIADIFYIK